MKLQERYDRIIDGIERLVSKDDVDIPQELSKETGLNLRLLGDAFQFMTDMTLVKYIRQRRLVHVLSRRLRFNLSVEQSAADAGFSDAAAFSKACKNEFELAPSLITEEVLNKYMPLHFENITSSKNVVQVESNALINTQKDNNICGVSAEQFAEIKLLLEYGAIYGLDDNEMQFVYHLATRCKTSIARAAEFYDDFKLQIENGSYTAGQSLYDVAELSFTYNLSFSESQSILYEISCHGYESIRDLPKGFFDIYFSEYNEKFAGYDVPYICEILYTLDDYGFSTEKITSVMEYVEILGVDPIELIENYDEYVSSFEKMVDESMHNPLFDDGEKLM